MKTSLDNQFAVAVSFKLKIKMRLMTDSSLWACMHPMICFEREGPRALRGAGFDRHFDDVGRVIGGRDEVVISSDLEERH